MELDRRDFLKTVLTGGATAAIAGSLAVCGAQAATSKESSASVSGSASGSASASGSTSASASSTSGSSAAGLAPLPANSPDPDSQFGIDLNINMDTIDDWLGRDDVAYRDMRMLFDPADYASIGGNADLSSTITGFKIVPYPYLATLTELPVEGAYDGETLFTLTWNDDGSIAEATPNYKESQTVLDDLFPKDKAIFLMCGGGGYAGMTKALLTFLGWDADKLYNVGGNWSYTGKNALELIVYAEEKGGDDMYATWRADYAYIDFDRLHAAE